MQTKTGVHYHLHAGPQQVALFDEYLEVFGSTTLQGPYYDILYDNVDGVHSAMNDIINSYVPGYLSEDDIEESYEYLEQMTSQVAYGDIEYVEISIEDFGMYFGIKVCNQCIPKGMN